MKALQIDSQNRQAIFLWWQNPRNRKQKLRPLGINELGQKRKLPPTEAITHFSQPCLTPKSLWTALHSTFNTALHRPINLNILDELAHKPRHSWNSFSEYEFKSAIDKCTNTSAPGPDKLTWQHWKLIIKDNMCLSKVINIADACISLSY